MALLWSFGHGLLLLAFLALSGGPVGVFIVARIDPDLTRERAVSVIGASVAFGVLLVVLSVALKRYVLRKGGVVVVSSRV